VSVPPRDVLRSVGPLAAASIVVANMIGQGVFLKGRAMLCEVGSAPVEIVAWGLAGLLVLCGALAFAELGTMMPSSGGLYPFLRRAYGEPVAFAFGWMMLFIGTPASIGALGVGAGIFFNQLSGGALDHLARTFALGGVQVTTSGTQWFALVLIAVVTLVNCAPVRTNGALATGFAVMKVAVLAGVTFAGFALAHAHAAVPAAALACAGVAASVRGGAAGFAAALLAALYAYNGWTSVTFVAGEVIAPARSIPRALVGGVGAVLVLYVLANTAFVRVLGAQAIAMLPPSASVGVAVAETLFGSAWGRIAAALLLISTIATLHIVVLAFSRVTFALAADGALFAPLARLSPTAVPVRAVLATSGISALLVLVAGFDALSDYYVFNTWIFIAPAVAALVILRRREAHAARPFRVPGYPIVPVLFVAVALWILLQAIVANPRGALIGIAIVAASLPVYFWRKGRLREPHDGARDERAGEDDQEHAQ
jgi:APA family basic amino acid/polyamine antiporter